MTTKTFQSLIEEINKEPNPSTSTPSEESSHLEELPVVDNIDLEILMHRDAHFSGNFTLMLDYYRQGGKGLCADFEIENIEKLALLEKNLSKNLSEHLLPDIDKCRVAQARNTYKKLQEIYEVKEKTKNHPYLIADLILTEEDPPKKAIEAIINEGTAILSDLLQLLRCDYFLDPLFPGYGTAPGWAATCLGKIGDEQAIIPLFEMIGRADFFTEDAVLKALKEIGTPAKEFLLQQLQNLPFSEDNERAAMALIPFKEDRNVSEVALQLLIDHSEIWEQYPLSSYIALLCEGIKNSKKLDQLLNNPKLPQILQDDLSTQR